MDSKETPETNQWPRLLVIVPDRLSDIIAKGELQPDYYNPGRVFAEVHILMTNDDSPDAKMLKGLVGDARLFVHNYPDNLNIVGRQPEWLTRRRLRRWAEGGVKIARKIAPNMIRCHGADWNAYLASRFKNRLGIPYVVSLHINPDVNPVRRFIKSDLSPSEARHNRFYEYLEREALRNADLVMPVYKPILPYLERLGVERVEVCYNVLNKLYLREKTDYALHDPARLIYVGRLFDLKDPSNIIRAVKQIDTLEFTIVGDGPIRPRLESLVTELGLTNRVFFRPAVPNNELCDLLAQSDIFAVHTEHWEISKSVLEAVLTGLPTIVNRRIGDPVPEFVEDNFILLVDNTPEAYQKAIESLLSDDNARTSLGRAAYDHAQANWAPEVTETKVTKIYRQMLNGNIPNGGQQ